MSYEDVINIINAHYGWSMDAHEPEYKGETKEKMKAMKQLVSELQAKSKAFDAIKTIVEARVDDEESNKAARSNDYEAGMLRAYEVMKYNIEDFYKGGESE